MKIASDEKEKQVVGNITGHALISLSIPIECFRQGFCTMGGLKKLKDLCGSVRTNISRIVEGFGQSAFD